MMDYGKLLRRSWEIVWGNKFMLLLGFLAALGSGGGGGGGNSNFSTSGDEFPGSPDFGGQLEAFWAQYAVLIIAAICFFFLLGILLWVIGLTARGGLISAAARIDAGEKMTFQQAFADGWSKIGQLIGVNLLLFLPLIIFGFVIAVVVAGAVGFSAFNMASVIAEEGDPTAAFGSFGIFFLLICCFVCLAIPLSIILNGISAFAQRGIMLQSLGVVDSIRHGWQILKSNLGDIIVLVIIFIVINLIVAFAAGIILLPVAFLSLGPLLFQAIQGSSIGAIEVAIGIVGGLLLLALGAAISSIFTAYQSTAFTLAYQEFLNKGSVQK